jgi:(2Fe-2S) ferredoxin
MKFQVLICDGPNCGVIHESDRLVTCAKQELAKSGATNVEIANFTCFDHCDAGPNLFVRKREPGDDAEPDSSVFRSQRGMYEGMDEAKVLRVLREHCATGEPIEELVGSY